MYTIQIRLVNSHCLYEKFLKVEPTGTVGMARDGNICGGPKMTFRFGYFGKLQTYNMFKCVLGRILPKGISRNVHKATFLR